MDHPRLRGEHTYQTAHFLRTMGSPPPTRGTQEDYIAFTKSARITPAYAGNTPISSKKISLGWDHPRLRGEHFQRVQKIINRLGSPPPTRGTLLSPPPRQIPNRITPAYAGNTCKRCITRRDVWDHPRLRGEHLIKQLKGLQNKGSPPPTRGTPRHRHIQR